MANQADVVVTNKLLSGDLEVSKSGNVVTIAVDGNERIPLLSPNEEMVLTAPEGKDLKYCPLEVKSDVDLSVTISRTDSTWTLKIIENNLPPDVPTTVNVTPGEEEP